MPHQFTQLLRSAFVFSGIALLYFVVVTPVLSDEPPLKNSLGMTLRLLPAGRYERGEQDAARGFSKDHSEFNSADDDRPVHPVVLTRPFYLAAHEVTVGQFRKFVTATGYKTSAERNERGAIGWDPTPPADQPKAIATFRDGGGFSWQKTGFTQDDNHPVVGVSFADAQAFCAWLSQQEKTKYRLPTEAEWEYAARAGTTTYFSFGNVYRGTIQKYANIGNVELEKAFPDRVRRQWLVDVERDPADRHVFTAPVGSYEANPWGLHDLYGNVWEWCEDRYLDTAYAGFNRPNYQEVRKRAIDPLETKAADDGDWRVIRGGSWFNAPVQCRSSIRGYYEANDGASYLGFRVLREAPAEAVAAARARFERSEAARETLGRVALNLREVRDGRLTVRVRDEGLTDEFFSALADLDDPVDLHHVESQGRLKADQLSRIAKVKQLTGLTLYNIGPGLTDDDFAPLADHPELEQLQINGNPKLTDALLRFLRKHTRFEMLQLDGNGITDAGLKTLPPQPELKTLYLTGTAVEGFVLEHWKTSPLTRFSCNHLSDEGARFLTEFPQLVELSVGGSPLTAAGCAQIALLRRLNSLSLNGCRQIPDEAFAALGDLYDLRSLTLTETAAGDRAIAGLVRLNYLRDLRMDGHHLTDAGMQQICGIVSLESLALQEPLPSNVPGGGENASPQATLSDAGLADLWRLVNLSHLELGAPGISGSGLASIRELPRLTGLHLSGVDITNAALQQVAFSPSLQRVVVGSWRSWRPPAVTDAGVQRLASAKNLKQVELLRPSEQVTAEGLESLRKKRPDMNVSKR